MILHSVCYRRGLKGCVLLVCQYMCLQTGRVCGKHLQPSLPLACPQDWHGRRSGLAEWMECFTGYPEQWYTEGLICLLIHPCHSPAPTRSSSACSVGLSAPFLESCSRFLPSLSSDLKVQAAALLVAPSSGIPQHLDSESLTPPQIAQIECTSIFVVI